MNWTLLVPGALLPPRLAPELVRAMRVPALVHQLALARPLPPPIRDAVQADPALQTSAAHWSWLAQSFGLDAQSLATAPYAWRAAPSGDAPEHTDADDDLWIAHCEPVHLAIARDHFVVTDLGEAPLRGPEIDELLDRANAVLASETSGAVPPLRLRVRNGQWFLVSSVPLQLRTWSLDAVLGQSVQDRLPVETGHGADARRWRVLGNEIQMSWHASQTTAARDEAGVRAANALWLHGGGTWRRLDGVAARALRIEPGSVESPVLRGWLQAGGACALAAAGTGADTLSICRELFGPYAHQAWESWMQRLATVEARIGTELTLARAAGAHRFDLVLCGAVQSRTIALPLQASWWRRLRANAHAPALLLERWLTETAHAGAQHGTLTA